ncbi:MAG TPA: hypothetical protein VKB53_13160, partial [Gammaproteobacteria bacterium]|nr:hypothetical protein [Gammaproteobacteria bacterium]
MLSVVLVVTMASLPGLRSDVVLAAVLANTASATPVARPTNFGTFEDNGEAHLRQALKSQRVEAGKKDAILYDVLAWAINDTREYGFNELANELALNDDRLNTMYKLVSRLSLVWFAGAARIGVHSGQCCLTRNQFG